MSEPLVVEVVRSGTVESSHLVDVAVVGARGELIASAGDARISAAFRSSAKPMQCRVALEAGWEPRDERHVAIACASHNGEPAHVEQVRAVLADAGVSEDALACPPDLPGYIPAMLDARTKRRVYHNCSGKQAAMLAACVAAGWPLAGYLDPHHPLQQRVYASMVSLLGLEPVVLVDGCGAPTFAGPLDAFARAFRAMDGGREAAAMRAHPFLVGGTDRFDTDLMNAAPHLLVKSGAEGLTCVAAPGYGIALKARDGDVRGRARGPSVVGVLRALGLLDDAALGSLGAHAEPPVLGGGAPVGSVRLRAPFAAR
jgi:L-asparaginase II